jgi:hypothetical protein
MPPVAVVCHRREMPPGAVVCRRRRRRQAANRGQQQREASRLPLLPKFNFCFFFEALKLEFEMRIAPNKLKSMNQACKRTK